MELDIAWRFESKMEVLQKLEITDSEIENSIWSKLKSDELIKNYSLNTDKFDGIEKIEFTTNYELISNKLKEFIKTNDRVILSWFSGTQTLSTDMKTFVNNWDDFFYPASDDLVVVHGNWEWIIYISHFECFQLGKGIKT